MKKIITIGLVAISILVVFNIDHVSNFIRTSTVNFSMQIYYASDNNTIDTSTAHSSTLINPNHSSLQTDVPEDALSPNNSIIMTRHTVPSNGITPDKPLPSEKNGAEYFYNISFKKVSDDSPVTSFDKDITLIFTYTNDDIDGLIEDTLVAYRWNGSSWITLANNTLDTESNTITATTQDFSYFGVIGDPVVVEDEDPETPTTPSTSGGGSPIRISKDRDYIKGDLNNDKQVDLIDFSIAAYWYKRTLDSDFLIIESRHLNGDKKIDLVDFSIMAYYFTT